MTKFLNSEGLPSLIALIKQAINGKADKTELPLVVNFTESNDVVTCDTSIADIYAAFSADREVVGHMSDDGQVNLFVCTENTVVFYWIFGDAVNYIIGNTANDVDSWAHIIEYIQEKLTFDSTPTANSSNPVKSGGVKTAIDNVQTSLNNYVTLDSNQNITGEKTFVGTKRIKFKQNTASDKLGFTLFNNDGTATNNEIGYLEYNPTAKSLALGFYKPASSTVTPTKLGFFHEDIKSTAAYKLFAPLSGDAKTKYELTSTAKEFYLPLGFTNGTSTVLTDTTGTVNISSLLPTNVSDLTNDAGYITSFTETDPTVPNHVKSITQQNITDWSNKQDALIFDNTPTANSNNPVKSSGIKNALDAKQEKDFIITLSLNNGVYTADKSFSEVLAAYNAGKTPVVRYYEYICNFVSYDESDFHFINHPYDELSVLYQATLHSNNTWEYSGLGLQEELIFDNTPTANSTKPVTSSGIKSALDTKQATLVSGTNIKTVNNNSLLGSGDVHFDGGNLVYSGNETYELVAGETIDQNLDRIDVLIHDLGTPNEIASITTSESSASGGNNTVTITETNGTTTTFNVKNGIDGQDGQDGADGVSLGEIALVQTTGDSEESVMSQKAVTDELLLDYSTNLRSLVWEGGLISSNNGANGTNGNYYRTRDYIEISDITTSVVLSIDGTFDIMFYNSSGGYLGYRTITNNSVEITRATYPTLGRIRACCYKTYYTIKNLANTTVKANNYELLKPAIKQTTGQSEGSLMSQKAITDSIYRNIKVQNCACGYLKPSTNHVINLTDAQYSRLNATDVASFRFILTEPENYVSASMTLRYVSINGNNTNSSANNAFTFGWDYSKRMFARGKNYNTATCINKTSSGTIINPLVFTLVWDRINGVIKYYERNTLISTQTYDEYKLDYFIAPSKSICFNGGDTGFYLYDAQIFDYDISKLFFATYENTLYGASMVFTKYANNFGNSTDNWVELNGSYSTYGGTYNGTIESTFPGDGTRVLTSTSNCTTSTFHTCGYYVGNSVQLQRWECDIEVVSGECAIKVGNASRSVITSIVDSNDNVYSGGDTLGVGSYTVKGVSGGTDVWCLYYRSGSMQVIYRKQRYKLISCVVHLKCDTFYDGFLYDDQAKHFYDQSNGLVPDNTPFTLPRTTTNNPPNYAGQMAVPSNGNIYIGTKNYVWKQINNS